MPMKTNALLLALAALLPGAAQAAPADLRAEILRTINAERQRAGAPHWRLRNRSIWATVLSPELRDVGIGLARMSGIPLYVFLFAEPEAEHFTQSTRGLGDLDRVRADLRAQSNPERGKAGAPPLALNADLQQAAQAHAQDMLARAFFAHKSPSGTTVRERSRKAGYDWRTIGENIAEGQTSVNEVMTTWMNSKGHRENILNPAFRELGVGLVLG